jgi:transcription initiation factor IIE alpha subunit
MESKKSYFERGLLTFKCKRCKAPLDGYPRFEYQETCKKCGEVNP